MTVGLGLDLVFCAFCLGMAFCVFWFSLDCFVLVSLAFVVLASVSSVLRQEIGFYSSFFACLRIIFVKKDNIVFEIYFMMSCRRQFK